MVGRPGKFQPRFTAGQLDKTLQANTEIDAYTKGAAEMTNARPLPQGGFTARDGLRKVDRVRGQTSVAASGGPYSVAAAAGVPTTVATLTFNDLTAITGVDAVAFGGSLPGGAAPGLAQPNPPESPLVAGAISAWYQNASNVWVQIGPALGLVDTLRTRRFCLPPGQTVLARAVRVVVAATTAGGVTVALAGLSAWAETPSPPAAVRLLPFTFSAEASYDLVVTPGGIDVYAVAGLVASIPAAFTVAQVSTFKWVQKLATMLITHQGFAPLQIQRQGADGEWNIQTAVFNGVPRYDFGDTVYTNATAAQWEVSFLNFDQQFAPTTPPVPSGGAHYTISVNGVSSYAIQQPQAGYAATAALLQAAISQIPGVAPGVTVSVVSVQPNLGTFLVTFGGSGNQGDGWSVSGTVLDKADAAIVCSKFTPGLRGGEPIMSATRGWPAACGFYQQRLLLGGFPQAPLGLLWSEQGNPWLLDTTLAAATAPMLTVLDGQGDETIRAIHLGRTLDVFTSYGEWWVQPGTISATAPPFIVYSTSNGIAPTVDPVESEGVTLFAYASGSVIAEYYYEYQFQNYAADPISLTASSLISGVIDTALQRATGSADINHHFLVLASGGAVLRATARRQQINAFAGMATDGRFLAVDVNARAEANFAVARQVNGQTVVFLEKATPGLPLDCAESVAVTAGQATISGLADFVGANVWAMVDGYAQGPFTVDATGSIALAFPALAAGIATVGRWTPPVVQTLPIPKDVGPRTVVRSPSRVHTVRLNVVDTANVAIAANNGDPYDAPLGRFGGAADTPPSANLATGWAVVQGLPGWDGEGQVTITQTRPGALTVTGVTIEVDL